ncbi:GNAT family N-acetyltransferase [Gluconacetobacter entanii]|uniref:GNAT family N-acetyltransferase n=1 Tax=Gluconacetobacter entanii TaxID=108528 RepID=UPI001C936A73|nr:GNAT family N-acetyltransferase [Gluconacetobacter entanii]MBY4641805.1 GNAT family N-acetyltransferase [Gluconacetobacter entanii]MCW4579697.1 GNAT family N-acetyltransferase [Gluconacetobacter entanii]MCW4583103.1 GNAT family N-acetyltransferase [Gluconacetobacter entanii]
MELHSHRLVLRPWEDRHRQPFADMSADPAVMEYMMPLTPHGAHTTWIDNQRAHQQEHGFCFWAVEDRTDGTFMGTVGLYRMGYDAHFTPAVEIGWRVARPFWGRGYAPEAAATCLRFGFETLGLPEIVANTAPDNLRSRRVMEKLGMMRDPRDDFDHPRVPSGHPLRRQVLYRLTREHWLAQNAA